MSAYFIRNTTFNYTYISCFFCVSGLFYTARMICQAGYKSIKSYREKKAVSLMPATEGESFLYCVIVHLRLCLPNHVRDGLLFCCSSWCTAFTEIVPPGVNGCSSNLHAPLHAWQPPPAVSRVNQACSVSRGLEARVF